MLTGWSVLEGLVLHGLENHESYFAQPNRKEQPGRSLHFELEPAFLRCDFLYEDYGLCSTSDVYTYAMCRGVVLLMRYVQLFLARGVSIAQECNSMIPLPHAANLGQHSDRDAACTSNAACTSVTQLQPVCTLARHAASTTAPWISEGRTR